MSLQNLEYEHAHNHSKKTLTGHEHYKECKQCHHTLAYCTCPVKENEIKSKTYTIKNLDCAKCGAKIEDKLNSLPGIRDCSVVYATKQLKVQAAHPDQMLPEITGISRQIEPDVTFIGKSKSSRKEETIKFDIKGLDCANCAAKVEAKLNQVPGISKASIDYNTGNLLVTGTDVGRRLPDLQKAADSVEDGVIIQVHQKGKTEDKDDDSSAKTELLQIIIGAALFFISWIFENQLGPILSLSLQILSYLILGGEVLLTAGKNILKGNIFDENFLMSVATLAAFAIGEYHEGIGVMLFYRIGEYFEDVAVARSRKQIISAVDLRPETVTLVTGDKNTVIPAESAKVGNIILVKPGDRIPLDGVVVEGDSRIDTSPVTGEPVPVHVGIKDEVTSGTINQNGLLKVRVSKPLEESMVTRILESVENAAANKPKMDRFITRFSKVYTPIVVLAAVILMTIPPLFLGNWHHWIYTAITFLVISCPCALVLSVPLAYFCGIGAASKLGILFKSGLAIEVLSKIKTVVMDKTGTVTEGNFCVQKIVPNGDISDDKLLTLAAECEMNSTHPIGQSILTAAHDRHLKLEEPEKVEEIAGQGIKAEIGNQTVLCGNSKLLENFKVNIENYHPTKAGTEVLLALDNQFMGSIEISDTIKPNTKEAVSYLKNHGLKTAMLTGDSLANAKAVAQKTGIEDVHAKLLPQDKLSELQTIRNEDGSVMFIGDGINDAPVLAGADIGAAMGSGSQAAIEAADIVFLTSDIKAVDDAYIIGKRTNRIAWENIVIALAIKALIMIMSLAGMANMWLAVFADTGVSMICILNSIRILSLGRKLNRDRK